MIVLKMTSSKPAHQLFLSNSPCEPRNTPADACRRGRPLAPWCRPRCDRSCGIPRPSRRSSQTRPWSPHCEAGRGSAPRAPSRWLPRRGTAPPARQSPPTRPRAPCARTYPSTRHSRPRQHGAGSRRYRPTRPEP